MDRQSLYAIVVSTRRIGWWQDADGVVAPVWDDGLIGEPISLTDDVDGLIAAELVTEVVDVEPLFVIDHELMKSLPQYRGPRPK
ncbi:MULTISPECIES: hypothetical protein [Nocardia]|uniref:hypothetical protein n=1 Tax=Nocardia TaxID=1817 RepID=UPI0007EAD633|nr:MULTISPECIES: hypothetical protein [Nocardia]MBF6278725.1 hypothetical protein [Nocardia nova]OBB48851.1 hypothetical protein A5748_01395 [Nocardia sp. 852002-51244_SCH5132740]